MLGQEQHGYPSDTIKNSKTPPAISCNNGHKGCCITSAAQTFTIIEDLADVLQAERSGFQWRPDLHGLINYDIDLDCASSRTDVCGVDWVGG